MLKQFQLNTSLLIFLVRFNEAREITAVLQTAPENISIGMHSHDFESTWVKVGVVVEMLLHPSF